MWLGNLAARDCRQTEEPRDAMPSDIALIRRFQGLDAKGWLSRASRSSSR